MKVRTWWIAAMITTAVISSAVVAQQGQWPAQPGAQAVQPGMPELKMGPDAYGIDRAVPTPANFRRIAEQLNLTDPQKASVAQLMKSHFEAIKPLMDQLPDLYKQLVNEMLKTSPDSVVAKDLLTNIHNLRGQIGLQAVDFWVDVRSILTAEQNQKLSEMLRNRMGFGRGIGIGGSGGPGGPPEGQPRPRRPGAGFGRPAPEPDPGF